MTAPPFRLVAVDLDGTLLNPEKRIADRDREAIARVARLGVAVAVISGRRFAELEELTTSLPQTAFRAGHGGALIRRNGRTILEAPLSRTAARRALEATAGMELISLISERDGAVRIRAADPGDPRVRRYLAQVRPQPRLEPAPRIRRPPLHLVFVGSITECRRARRRVGDRVGAGTPAASAALEMTEYPDDGFALLDVIRADAGKGPALVRIAAEIGADPEETLAIGDNWNDLGMLRAAGLGVLMGNAAPELHELGFPVTASNRAAGVAEALDRLIPAG